ncbi:acyl-CoA thioesterase [Aurantiacibacter aquimixticola]|uniref:Acyl-CoA thioesterase n=1 Tax=Aurantiacibacter aquimixticola TaxID=1958945 RepID=A0A419RUH9_9SPHN|nr:thioesterase family protein [Aurantiacibacter aquimixticola]RJY09404.1 acyl-CoA thioesterase [Aurantiacibacter aquimixticola]
MSNTYARTFVARPEHIDVNGHVNNAVWLRWMEELSGEHWERDAREEDRDLYVWLVLRHEIDYRGNIVEGEETTGETAIHEGPRGPRFVRHFTFTDTEGKELVRAQTTWAMVDKATGKLMRVPGEVAAPFMPEGGWATAR